MMKKENFAKTILATMISATLLTGCGGGAGGESSTESNNETENTSSSENETSTSTGNTWLDLANSQNTQEQEIQTQTIGGIEFPVVEKDSFEFTPTNVNWANDGTGTTAQIVSDLQALFRAAGITGHNLQQRVDNNIYDDSRYAVDYSSDSNGWPTVANRHTTYQDGSTPKNEIFLRTTSNTLSSPTEANLSSTGEKTDYSIYTYEKLQCSNGQAYTQTFEKTEDTLTGTGIPDKLHSKEYRYANCVITDGTNQMTAQGYFTHSNTNDNVLSKKTFFRSNLTTFDVQFTNSQNYKTIYKGSLNERAQHNNIQTSLSSRYETTKTGSFEILYTLDATSTGEKYFKINTLVWKDSSDFYGINNEISFSFSTNDSYFAGSVKTNTPFQIEHGATVFKKGEMVITTKLVDYRITANGTDLLKLEIDSGKDGVYEKSDLISPYSVGLGKQIGNIFDAAAYQKIK